MNKSARKEKVKRLQPKLSVMREIFAKSGNACAFPGCAERIVEPDGTLVGQLCHIEAAERGGPRFNATMTNEDRRKASNLMLMCYKHHVITDDDEEEYSVERMKEIKEQQESKFAGLLDALAENVTDQTRLESATYPASLVSLNNIFNWGLNGDELALSYDEFLDFINRLAKIPKNGRQLLEIILQRAYEENRYDWVIAYSELQHVVTSDPVTLHNLVLMLGKYKFVHDAGEDINGQTLVGLTNMPSDWPIWSDFKELSAICNVNLSRLIVDMDFAILDDLEVYM